MRVMALCVAVALASCAAGVPKPASPPRTTSLGIDLSGFNLGNGLRVVFVHDPHATEVQVTTRYRVGVIDEPDDQRGVAHLVEHLMFQQIIGQQTVFSRLLDITTMVNANTTEDATSYFARALPAHLDELLAIEGIRLGLRCTSVTAAAFEREREVVINELRMKDDRLSAHRDLYAGLYGDGHPYARNDAGTEASVRALTREQACAFADAHYAPGNAVMVVSGNLAADKVQAALGKYLVNIPSRKTTPAVPVQPLPGIAREVAITTDIDKPLVVVAWPLPDDAKLRAQVRAVVQATVASIDARVAGIAVATEIGDERAPMIAIAVTTNHDESIDNVVSAIRGGIAAAPAQFAEVSPAWLGEALFDNIKQTAIYKLYSGLEDGSGRDIHFARELLAGRNPSQSLAGAFQGLRSLDRTRATEVVRDQLNVERATIVELRPRTATKHGREPTLAAPIHDLGQHRETPDPAVAHRAAEGSPVAGGAPITRVLANGMRVVLVPQTSVPTVDVRIVFAAGTADDPEQSRGVALVAGHGLTWNVRHINDMLRFFAAAGEQHVSVEPDATTFSAHGLDMHLDLLLSGLRRIVRDGHYDDSTIRSLALALRREPRSDLGEQYRVAAYGADHPYVKGGVGRDVSETLRRDDANAFRAARFTPDNATLIIAGHFDAALADRWIDYLFADWTGHAQPRDSPQTTLRATALARVRDSTMAIVAIKLPAPTGTRARKLVMAEMLNEIAADIRHQLGASYTSRASLNERRLSTSYEMEGSIDASRVREAVELLRSRIAKLREDHAEAERAFVWARTRVLTHLEAATQSATSLAGAVADDIVMGRAPMSAARTADEVRVLTVDDMPPTFADLDLARAIVMMIGPKTGIDPAFAALGREPSYVVEIEDDDSSTQHGTRPAVRPTDEAIYRGEITDALAGDEAPVRLALGLSTGYSTGNVNHDGVSGMRIAADIGFHIDPDTAVGVQIGAGYLSGDYDTGAFLPMLHPISVVPVDVDVFARVSGYDRLWGAAFAGLHLDRVNNEGARSWGGGFGVGIQGGVDLWRMQRGRFGLFGRVESELGSSTSFAAFSLGIAYHR